MKKYRIMKCLSLMLAAAALSAVSGCTSEKQSDGVTEIELVHYKPEAVEAFKEIEQKFNETHSDIQLRIESPNEAMTILKTRFIREDYPDIVGIGGDMDYSNFLDADMFMDISDFDGVCDITEAYLKIDDELELLPKDGIYALPYAANAVGILYNKDMFEEYGWETPETWDEFIALCDKIRSDGVQPLFFGFKDTWTCLSPWNALAVDLTPSDTCAKVNAGETTFTKEYHVVAEKLKELIRYTDSNPFAYNYNDACTAFARGESAMYTIGSYAVPQIKSVNPDITIDTFIFPANDNEGDNVLNSGVDLQFSVMSACENKEAAYEVLRFLFDDETVQIYLDNQTAVPCKEGDFVLPSVLDGVKSYIDEGRVGDFHDHHYPSEMSVDAIIQTFLLDNSENSVDTFLSRFDKEWVRYNRDLIKRVKEYEEGLE
ncbi:MAG: ABC transporter substrate-binding protein [Candidatus Ornithomonoglobus sp.]